MLLIALGAGGRSLAQPVEAKAPLPPEKSPTVDGNHAASIAGARKEFEAVKSLRNNSGGQKMETPRMTVPRMQTEPTPGLVAPTQSSRGGEKRPTHWLIDAMEQNATVKGQRGSEGRFSGSGPMDQRKEREERLAPHVERGTREHGVPTNPFAQYLGDWISPQDYALLKPAVAPVDAGRDLRTRDPMPQPSLEAFSPLPDSRSKPLVPAKVFGAATVATGTDRVNPYLEVLKSPGVTPLSMPGVATPKATIATAPAVPKSGKTTIPDLPPEPPRSRPPDYVRPNADDKYFKQLKRF